MKIDVRAILKHLWIQTDKLQLAGLFVGIISLWFVYFQLRENNETNKVAIRGQLYDRQLGIAAEASSSDAGTLNTIWMLIPSEISTDQRASTLLPLITADPTALKSKNAADLYHGMFDLNVFVDKSRRDGTKDLRHLFLHTQTSFYHVYNIFDYQREKILSDGEWRTWKGLLREMHAHPMLLTVIWQGYENRYFSRAFAVFLQAELNPDNTPSDIADIEAFKRDREFVRLFYPDMMRKDWPNALPNY